MLGKQKCRILKEIRQRIADENDIPYVTRECTHKGECRGTCPRCESELRYLERELAARQAMGKRVAVAALCAGLAFSSVGCGPLVDPGPTAGAPEPPPARHTPRPEETPDPDDWELDGEIELMGDVAYVDPPELEGEPTVDYDGSFVGTDPAPEEGGHD